MDLDFCIVVSVTFFSGKRSTIPRLNSMVYRPHLLVKGDKEYLGVCFIEGDLCGFNQSADAVVLPVYDGVNYHKLAFNTQFFIMEGPVTAGEGVVKDILPYIPYKELLQNKIDN